MDPPYGIKFGSNWQVSTRKRDVRDGRMEDATRQPEQIRAFRDTWELGVHSYLAYLRDRFAVASELMTETGSIFVQIGDENVHLVRSLLDEVFGSENFCSLITFQKTAAVSSPEARTNVIGTTSDFILWYAKSIKQVKYRQLYLDKDVGVGAGIAYRSVRLADGSTRPIAANEVADPALLPEGARVFQATALQSPGYSDALSRPFDFQGHEYTPAANAHWKTTLSGLAKLALAGRLAVSGNTIRYVRFVDDFAVSPLANVWSDVMGSPDVIYVVQTNPRVIARCVLMTTDPGDLVLDPTCGGGTTAYVAEQWGRRWITIDTSRVALALTRTRLISARFPYYFLADSLEGLKKEAELTGAIGEHKTSGDIKKGFVYKRIPHVTLKSIANNPDIHDDMSRPEVDAAISRNADTEALFDQPFEDEKRIRVSGPFTVESLSPHRVLATDEDRPASERNGSHDTDASDFASVIIDNLKKAGIQNTKKSERLKFDTLEPFAGRYIQAAGDYTEGELPRRAAVTIGPQYGTVDADIIKEAAKEALRGAGFDLLVVCGFAFDAHASEAAKEFQPEKPEAEQEDLFIAEEQKQFGKLPILLARMNPDLAMGDELLKKTGAGNLFTVFGEPDLTIDRLADGKVTVEIKGVDVYDPTTGVVRSNSTDDIACWFIDTNYNAESFFVRQCVFHRRRRPVRKAEARTPRRHRRSCLGSALLHQELPLRPALIRQDRRQSHQPLWR